MAADARRPRPVRAGHPRAGVREQRSGTPATESYAHFIRGTHTTYPERHIFDFTHASGQHGWGWYSASYAINDTIYPLTHADTDPAAQRPAAPSQSRDASVERES